MTFPTGRRASYGSPSTASWRHPHLGDDCTDPGARVLGRFDPDPAAGARLNLVALDRLGMATPSDVARFWGAVSLAEVPAWADRQRDLVAIRWQRADGN